MSGSPTFISTGSFWRPTHISYSPLWDFHSWATEEDLAGLKFMDLQKNGIVATTIEAA